MESENKTPEEPEIEAKLENQMPEEEKKPSVGDLIGGFFFTFFLSAPFAIPILFFMSLIMYMGFLPDSDQLFGGIMALIIFLVVLVGWIFILKYFTKKFAINKPKWSIGSDPTKPDDGKIEGTYETRSYTVNKGKGPAFERTYTTVNKKK